MLGGVRLYFYIVPPTPLTCWCHTWTAPNQGTSFFTATNQGTSTVPATNQGTSNFPAHKETCGTKFLNFVNIGIIFTPVEDQVVVASSYGSDLSLRPPGCLTLFLAACRLLFTTYLDLCQVATVRVERKRSESRKWLNMIGRQSFPELHQQSYDVTHPCDQPWSHIQPQTWDIEYQEEYLGSQPGNYCLTQWIWVKVYFWIIYTEHFKTVLRQLSEFFKDFILRSKLNYLQVVWLGKMSKNERIPCEFCLNFLLLH